MALFRGTPVSEGMAAGELYLPDRLPPGAPAGEHPPAGGMASAPERTVTPADVRAAFAAVTADRTELAAVLRAAGREAEAGIVEIGALIAADPALSAPVLGAFSQAAPVSLPAALAVAAIREAAEVQAGILAALPDPDLAQRASDVRQVAQAVIARLTGTATPPPPPDVAFILVCHEVDPADIIRLADGGNLAGAVSVAGGASSHAAIIARGLGLPMLAGVDPAVLSDLTVAGNPATRNGPAGRQAILDATVGELRTDPSPADLARVSGTASGQARVAAAAQGTVSAGSARGQVRTADGAVVTVLCNVASAAETRLGLAGGAAGVGLLRSEIPFTRATRWPSRADHLAALSPILAQLAGRRAVVRLLDFAGDKVPPFGGAEGLDAFLAAPRALDDQLAAVLAAGADTDLAVMIPMVRSLDEVHQVRTRLASSAKVAGRPAPPLGMMVELAATAADAASFAPHVDFFSIGTNDLTADVLRRPRTSLGPADAAAPEVLAAISGVIEAGRRSRIGVSVCGDAAADPAVLPRLLALGVRTVSVGAAKVPKVAQWITATATTEAVTQRAG
jgi:phosphoenolpyruvate-protein kinase (PTS system EI component)